MWRRNFSARSFSAAASAFGLQHCCLAQSDQADAMSSIARSAQREIVAVLQEADDGKLVLHEWSAPGDPRTKSITWTLQDGRVFERTAVSVPRIS